MSERVSVDDLAAAAVLLTRAAEGMQHDDTDDYEAALRVVTWLDRERQRRYRQMARRTLPGLLGDRRVTVNDR